MDGNVGLGVHRRVFLEDRKSGKSRREVATLGSDKFRNVWRYSELAFLEILYGMRDER